MCKISEREKNNAIQKLKVADVTPVYKKKDPNLLETYKLVSVLPDVSKIL